MYPQHCGQTNVSRRSEKDDKKKKNIFFAFFMYGFSFFYRLFQKKCYSPISLMVGEIASSPCLKSEFRINGNKDLIRYKKGSLVAMVKVINNPADSSDKGFRNDNR